MLSPSLLIPTLVLLISLPLLFLIAPTRPLPIKDLQISLSPDELDDVALFHKAILASSSHSSTAISHLATKTNPNPKIAFLFLTNSDLYFAPLWEKFFHRHHHLYNIYIHADPTVPITTPGGVFHDRFIPSKKTERGSPSLVSAARRLLASAVLDDPLNQYFALVSQHCIPLHSFSFVYKTLFGKTQFSTLNHFASPSKSFIEIISDDPNLPERYSARGDNTMLPEIPFDRFKVGSQFYILTRRHALLVIQDKKRLWRKFKLPCLNIYSCYPEEHYFPTLLAMEDPKGCSHYTLTRVNWTDSTDGHPYTYGASEISAGLVEMLRKSNSSSYSYLFARKFSPDCLTPLMELAGHVIFK